MILLYHRIARLPYDPWGLAVTPEHFAEQLRIVGQTRLPLSMTSFVKALETRKIHREAIAVTFDDGYRDNLVMAKPLLQEAAIPATIFLTTGYLDENREFWWDELARLILGSQTAIDGTVSIAGNLTRITLPAVLDDGAITMSWRAWHSPQTQRQALYVRLWRQISRQPKDDRDQVMQQLRALQPQSHEIAGDLPMSRLDIRQLLKGSGLDIGAHSKTHPHLTSLSIEERRREIIESRSACEALVQKPVEGFTYPYGDMDLATKNLVQESGYDWACSMERGTVDPSQFDRFALPRIQTVSIAHPRFLDYWRHFEGS
jgi:peptidoglycan/xylan/chitin deacetylase (PgdA/CDA1 family)